MSILKARVSTNKLHDLGRLGERGSSAVSECDVFANPYAYSTYVHAYGAPPMGKALDLLLQKKAKPNYGDFEREAYGRQCHTASS